MSAPIIALLGTALFEAGQPAPDPAALERALSLLARAVEGAPVTLDTDGGVLRVNGSALPTASPGARIVLQALIGQGTGRLQLPGGLEPRHWRDVVQLYALPAGSFATATHLRDALRHHLPMAEHWASEGQVEGRLAAPAQEPARPAAGTPPLTDRAGDLGSFSTELARLQEEGSLGVERRDAATVARVLLRFAVMEREGDPGHAMIVAKERQRVLTAPAVQWLIREAAKPQTPATAGEALATLGRHMIEPLLDGIAESGTPGEREALILVLAAIPDLEIQIVAVLRGHVPALLRAAATVAGRRHMEKTIPALATLLRHTDVDVRTAAWRALEEIGTREAFDALNARSR